MSQWIRIHGHEISRRRRLHKENPDLFNKIHSLNPKGLLDKEDCVKHVWVPATHLWIHDAAAKSVTIGGVKRRGFQEAFPFLKDNHQVVPQMCWRCDALRYFHLASWSALAQRSKFKAKKKREKWNLEDRFDELFS